MTKLKDTSVKLSEILTTRKDNVSRFEEETNAVLAEVTELSSLKSIVDNWRDLFETCLPKGSEIQCLVVT